MLQETIDSQRDMLKAFLMAEIRGWTDAVADPAGAAELAVNDLRQGPRASTSPARPSRPPRRTS